MNVIKKYAGSENNSAYFFCIKWHDSKVDNPMNVIFSWCRSPKKICHIWPKFKVWLYLVHKRKVILTLTPLPFCNSVERFQVRPEIYNCRRPF